MPYLIFRRAVHCVARKGCVHGREMHPYLMRSTGLESETQQAVFVACIQALPMRYRALAPGHIAARAQSFHRVGAVDRLVYCAAPLEVSADDGYISFIYIARKACRRIAVQGADNNARCAFVEPADAAEHCALPLALQMPGDCVCERVALMASREMAIC